MCNKRYTSKTKNKEIRSVSGKTDSPMSLLFCSRFSGWILYWRMDVIPRNPSYSASFSPIIFLLHYPFLISLYLGLNMYISKDDDYVPTFESPWIHRGWTTALSLLGRERIPGVPTESQEEALSTGKARGIPGSWHHSQSPPDVSVHSRETSLPCTASAFKPRIDSHHGGTWDSPVGKPRGKASWESIEGKPQIPWSTRREAWHCSYSSEGKPKCMPPIWRGLTPMGRL